MGTEKKNDSETSSPGLLLLRACTTVHPCPPTEVKGFFLILRVAARISRQEHRDNSPCKHRGAGHNLQLRYWERHRRYVGGGEGGRLVGKWMGRWGEGGNLNKRIETVSPSRSRELSATFGVRRDKEY